MPTITDYLKYANLQMAAEAFLVDANDIPFSGIEDIERALKTGNDHATKFTETEATKFTTEWQVVAQKPNTPSGFSGTLFRNNATNEYVISFRSTEFIDDAIRDSAATGALEIFNTGWAFGQLSDMEAWYQSIKSQIDGPLNVTGYSLGGHLATAFNLLRREDAAAGLPTIIPGQVVTFNGAGVGNIKDGGTLHDTLNYFNTLRANPTTELKAALNLTIGVSMTFVFRPSLPRSNPMRYEAMRISSGAPSCQRRLSRIPASPTREAESTPCRASGMTNPKCALPDAQRQEFGAGDTAVTHLPRTPKLHAACNSSRKILRSAPMVTGALFCARDTASASLINVW